MVGLDTFIESLPPHLNQAVTLAIHNDTFRQHPLFKKLKNKKLLAYIGSHLRPQFNSSGDLIYRQGEEITSMYIVTCGLAAFVQPRQSNAIFAVVNPRPEDYSERNLKHLGYEDSVVNHLSLLRDINENDLDTIDLDKRTNTNLLSKRFFTVRAIE